MNPMTTKGDLLRYLDSCACQYHGEAAASIARNSHMNTLGGVAPSQEAINAVLVDFVNWVGLHQGLDYGMYVKDLKGPRS